MMRALYLICLIAIGYALARVVDRIRRTHNRPPIIGA